jgi:hypothetical protein
MQTWHYQELSSMKSIATSSLVSSDQNVVLQLIQAPGDAEALRAIHDSHGPILTDAAVRWFGRSGGVYKNAVFNILVSLGRDLRTFDPRSMDFVEWVRHRSDIEARRLRTLWNVRQNDSPIRQGK